MRLEPRALKISLSLAPPPSAFDRAIHADCAPDRHRSPRGMLHREDQNSQVLESTSCRSRLTEGHVTTSCSPNHKRAALQVALTRNDSRSEQRMNRSPVAPLSFVGSVNRLDFSVVGKMPQSQVNRVIRCSIPQRSHFGLMLPMEAGCEAKGILLSQPQPLLPASTSRPMRCRGTEVLPNDTRSAHLDHRYWTIDLLRSGAKPRLLFCHYAQAAHTDDHQHQSREP